MRAQATGHAGDPNVYTPNLDRLAAEGCRFTHAVSGSPWCTPFRGALMTGKYPHLNGISRNGDQLREDQPTVARILREQGYRTCLVGKWHLDGRPVQRSDLSTEEEQSFRFIPPQRRGGL